MKKILSMFLAIIMLASLFAVCAVPATAAKEETRVDVGFSTVQFSAEQATWILHEYDTQNAAYGIVYRLENQATGLYLTMEKDANDELILFQTSARAENDSSQWFKFLSLGTYRIIYNVPFNRVVYASASGNEIKFVNASNWYNILSSTGEVNYCQFNTSEAPAEGVKYVIRMAGGGAYLQSPVKTADEVSGEVVFSTAVASPQQSTWVLEATKGTTGYRLKNKATNLYLAMEKDGESYKLHQTSDRGENTNQIFCIQKASEWNGNIYYIIYNIAFNMVIYSNEVGNGLLFKGFDSWSTYPEGVTSNNRAQFIATIADGAEIQIKMQNGAYLQSKKYSVPEYTADVMMSKTHYSAGRSTWILHAASGSFRLENKATGLYLTMEHDGTNSKLFQASDRGESDGTQLFAFVRTGGTYFMLKNVPLNRTIYSNTAGDEILFKSAGEWMTPPEGANHRNLCQFNATVDPADGVEYVIKMAGGGAYLQSAVGSANEKSDVAVLSKDQNNDDLSSWKFHAVTNGYQLENVATGLYLTMEKDGDSYKVFQATNRGADDKTQIFGFTGTAGAGSTYFFMFNVDLGVVIYSNDAGDSFLFKSKSSWHIPPEGASSNGCCSFKAAEGIADNGVYVIQMNGASQAFLRAQNEFVDITVTADGNGTVTDITKAEIGTSVTVSAVANDGYAFTGWYVGGELVNADAQYTFTVSDATALTAKFVAYGDNDLDGEITLDDLIAIRKSIINKADYSIGCDANADSEIDIRDLVAVKKLLSNIA